ncbi:Prostaglandin E synthase 2 [Porphyridium purpureum]|uniref:Prostaglandin E synthase 2 n=1 Tax=Porphyridium purpureum TaxID=35688 RepID=A0A5J4YNX9_PORPP|nr:Prostaglandin E synthase 2 [Porphyridium purpureum]|eukprot:POR1804..scf295_9
MPAMSQMWGTRIGKSLLARGAPLGAWGVATGGGAGCHVRTLGSWVGQHGAYYYRGRQGREEAGSFSPLKSVLRGATISGAVLYSGLAMQMNTHSAGLFPVVHAEAAAMGSTSGAGSGRAMSTMSADSSSTTEPMDIVLYQYEVCPFCNKVRAFLDFHKIPYKTVEVNPMNKAEIKFSEYKKVPVVLINGKQFNDSSEIIKQINCDVAHDGRYTMTEEEERWFSWVDSRLTKILPPNIYRTVRESIQTFEYLVPISNFTWWQKESAKYFGSFVMYAVSKKLKKKHNIGDERETLYAEVNAFVDALEGRDFLGGDKPNLADLAIFGVLRSVESMDTFNDMMAHSNIKPWYERMQQQVGDSMGARCFSLACWHDQCDGVTFEQRCSKLLTLCVFSTLTRGINANLLGIAQNQVHVLVKAYNHALHVQIRLIVEPHAHSRFCLQKLEDQIDRLYHYLRAAAARARRHA